ncbi:MAG: hypothetical protein HPY83_08955 [Anaerolineae bacterium]|nr:hypothetical protein [Anaerolineae bacterium]
MRVIAGDAIRPNLRLEVWRVRNLDDKLGWLVALCRMEAGSGIVYVDTRARAEELAALLRGQGTEAQHYHAGIPNRGQVQDDFMAGRTRIVVATVAFGLGIDKPDIRFIVHFAPPPSLEAYYQEAGRAGRDGLPARCVLMYSPADRRVLTRRSRRDRLTVEQLRDTHAAVRRRLGGASVGRVAEADLLRDLQVDELTLRVALGFLEQAGLLRRGFDVPRAARVRLDAEEVPEGLTQLTAFCRAARLRPGQMLSLDVMGAARRAGLPLAEAELHLVRWADEGWITYRPAGRDLLLELLPSPPDAPARVRELLERHAMIQAQRVDDIAAYAETRRCRHGYVAQYLGGRTVKRCQACDNCLGASTPAAGLPGEAEQLRTVLECVAGGPWSWGRGSLIRILRGDPKAPERGREQPGFGALAFRSRSAIEGMLVRLEAEGFLARRQLAHGGEVLDLTRAGSEATRDLEMLERLVEPAPAPPLSPGRATPEGDQRPLVDEGLLGALRAWRLEEARAAGVPSYFILHLSVLREIAARRPSSLEELGAIKGIGKGKLAQYGEAVLGVVRSHPPASATMQHDDE